MYSFILEGGFITDQKYWDEVVQPVVYCFASVTRGSFVFMHDNAHAHVYHAAMAYLEEVGRHCMNWPTCSPDIIPIKLAHDMLGRRIHECQ